MGVEPAPDGDRDLLVDALAAEDVALESAYDGLLVFHSISGQVNPGRFFTGDLAAHVDRVVAGANNDSAGACRASYYEHDGNGLVQRDAVTMQSQMASELFGFLARRYEMHVPV